MGVRTAVAQGAFGPLAPLAFRAPTRTVAPRMPSSRAVSNPMPLLAPVIRAIIVMPPSLYPTLATAQRPGEAGTGRTIGDLSAVPASNRNMICWMFMRPETDTHWNDADTLRFTRGSVADLRAAYARYPGDRGINGLVTELLGVSPRFAEMWAAHEVEVRRRIVKRVDHPLAGPLEFECQVLHVPDTDQRPIVYCAAPGSPTQEAFRRLAGCAYSPTSRPTSG